MSLFSKTGDNGAIGMESQRQGNIAQGEGQLDAQFSQFNPQFYQNYTQKVLGAETPQLMSQYATTGKNLTYALARGGNVNSSAAEQENQSLQNQLGVNEATVANRAVDQTNELRSNVNNQKAELTNQLVQGGQPSSVASQAAASVSQDRAPSAIQPLGNLFGDWANTYLANKTAQAFSGNGQQPLGALLNQGFGTASAI